MLLESFFLPGGSSLSGHGHVPLHVCLVRGGGFAERIGGDWRECGPGLVRISPGSTRHELEVAPQGAQGQIFELPDRLARGLPRRPTESVFLGEPPVGDAWERLSRPRSRFEAESAALELVARSMACTPHGAPPAWLVDLRYALDESPDGHSLAALARRIGRHRSHVARSFRNWYGRPIGEHVRALRAAWAEVRLRTTDQPITEVATELGFADQAHFTRVFRDHYGAPPARYRRAGGT